MLCDWAHCLCACHEGMVVYFFIQTQILYTGMPVNKVSQKINKCFIPLHFWSSGATQITSATCSCLIYLFSLNYYSGVSLSITPHVPDFNLWWSPIFTTIVWNSFAWFQWIRMTFGWQVVSCYNADHTIHEPRHSAVFICYKYAWNKCQLSLHTWPLHQLWSHAVLPTSDCGCSDTVWSSPSSRCGAWSHISYCTLTLMYIFIEFRPTYWGCLCLIDIWQISYS